MKIYHLIVQEKIVWFLTSGLLQDDPPNDTSPIHLFAEFLKNIAEFLFIIAPKILTGIPTSKEAFIEMLLKGNAEAIFNEWAENVLAVGFVESRVWYYIFLAFALIAMGLLFFKLGWYLISLGAKVAEGYSPEEIMRGQAEISTPLTYLIIRFLPALFIILGIPVLIVWGIRMLHGWMMQFAAMIYGDITIGGALYQVLLNLLDFENALWILFGAGSLIVMFIVFIVQYLVINLAVIILGIWMMFNVARYGDGKEGVEAITDSAFLVFRFVFLIIILRFFWWIGPLFLAFAPEITSSTGIYSPVVFWIGAWLALLAGFPWVYLILFPRLGYKLGKGVRKLYLNVNTPGYVGARSDFMKGAKGIEVTRFNAGKVVIDTGKAAWDLYKKLPI